MTKDLAISLKRLVLVFVAALLVLLSSASNYFLATVYAGQVTERKVTISNSTPSATGVTYTVSFKPTTTNTIGGIVVDFCADTPLVGTNACTLPTGFTLSNTPAVSGITGIGATGWVTTNSLQGAAAASNKQVLKLTNPTPQTPTGTTTAISFDITTVTNPSTACSTATACSFYGRILTFDTEANATSQYTATGSTRATTFANMRDYGGVALSTATSIGLTARVMETLSFCVYNASCGDSTAVELGTGTPASIGTGSVYTDDLSFSLSTNSLNGIVVRLKGDTLKAGVNDIAPAGATASAIAAGTEEFGVRVVTPGSVTAVAPYNDGANYGLDVTTGGENLTTTYGDQFATAAGAIASSVTTFRYAATAGSATPAGIYTATHQFIATGTF